MKGWEWAEVSEFTLRDLGKKPSGRWYGDLDLNREINDFWSQQGLEREFSEACNYYFIFLLLSFGFSLISSHKSSPITKFPISVCSRPISVFLGCWFSSSQEPFFFNSRWDF